MYLLVSLIHFLRVNLFLKDGKVFLVKLRILSTHGNHEKAMKGVVSLLAELEALNTSNEPDLLSKTE